MGIKFCNSDIVILAVKPNQIKPICNEINSLIIEKKDLPVVISIAAGVTTTSIKDYIIQENLSHLQNFLNIYRAMPNLCASNGDSITGLFGSSVSDITISKNIVSEIFNSVGEILWVKKESDLNIVTAISGSGPAYIFYIMEIMINSAQKLGLSEKDAKKLVTMTLIGSGKMGLSIQNLKEQISKVSSKGGTTEAAIKVFEKENKTQFRRIGISLVVFPLGRFHRITLLFYIHESSSPNHSCIYHWNDLDPWNYLLFLASLRSLFPPSEICSTQSHHEVN